MTLSLLLAAALLLLGGLWGLRKAIFLWMAFRSAGGRIKLNSSCSTLSEYLQCPPSHNPVFLYEGVCICDGQEDQSVGLSTSLALSPNDYPRRLRCLAIGCYEALERHYLHDAVESVTNVQSNGVAIHSDAALAAEASRRELMERDVVLLHYYCHRPPAAMLDLQLSLGECNDPELATVQVAARGLDGAKVYLLQSVYLGTMVTICEIVSDSRVAVGFGCGRTNDSSVITKAFHESLRVLRAWCVGEVRQLIQTARTGAFSDLQTENFCARAQQLAGCSTQLQLGLLLAELLDPEVRAFLHAAPAKAGLPAFLASETPFLDQTQHPIAPAQIETKQLSLPFRFSLPTFHSTSPDAFAPAWPKAPEDEIVRVARLRKVDSLLGVNTRRVCLVG